ncbi:MAG: hypothetical protein B7Z73_00355 [Planctomycetia bacterium 21-64-5]|nr:MAG: hypothetical protein B7Z73_00355 [Planctomycetia bacterium 21-64-5]
MLHQNWNLASFVPTGTGFTEEYQNGKFIRNDALQWKRQGGRLLVTDLKGRFSDDTDFYFRR